VTNRYSDEEMLDDMRRVANGRRLIGPQFKREGRISIAAILVRFGTWRDALARAGLPAPVAEKGGRHRPCDICGKPYRFGGGPKSSKTCGRACSGELRSRSLTAGDSASLQAARGRAARVAPMRQCDRCGAPPGKRAHDRHHRDRNPYNNDPSNVEVLCRGCHVEEHRAAGDGWSTSKNRGPRRPLSSLGIERLP
jgi:Homing endonuclease associated repeat